MILTFLLAVGWLRDGAPMGIKRNIELSGGIFPETAGSATLHADDVFAQAFRGNHPSFRDVDLHGSAAGMDTIRAHLDQGFGWLFRDRADAERFLGSRIAPAPLGCITKLRADGTPKHRVIMDLRRNLVNEAAVVPERQVLPTVFHHGLDLAELSKDMNVEGNALHTMVLDFADAFMNISLHADEQPYNC